MIQSYEDLIDVLEKEFSLCTQLVMLMQKEKEVIISLDPRALEDILVEKEAVSTRIRTLEEARERILERLGLKNKTISQVAAVADADFSEKLNGIAVKFTSVIQSIAELNRLNGKLIEKSLFYIRTSCIFLNSFGVTARQRVSLEA